MSKKKPIISTVQLSWNRLHLLKKTVSSYLDTISVPYELIFVDNVSTDGAKEYIENICKDEPRHKAIFLNENCGAAEAMNMGLDIASGSFLHISENDVEYFEGWDKSALHNFAMFPELGQISPFAPAKNLRQKEYVEKLTRGDRTIYKTKNNVVCTSIFRRELWDKGIRWKLINKKGNPKMKLSADAKFSSDVKNFGYIVAWDKKDYAMNWGFDFNEVITHLDYYISNYNSKTRLGEFDGFKDMLKEVGFDLIYENGKYKAVKKITISKERVNKAITNLKKVQQTSQVIFKKYKKIKKEFYTARKKVTTTKKKVEEDRINLQELKKKVEMTKEKLEQVRVNYSGIKKKNKIEPLKQELEILRIRRKTLRKKFEEDYGEYVNNKKKIEEIFEDFKSTNKEVKIAIQELKLKKENLAEARREFDSDTSKKLKT